MSLDPLSSEGLYTHGSAVHRRGSTGIDRSDVLPRDIECDEVVEGKTSTISSRVCLREDRDREGRDREGGSRGGRIIPRTTPILHRTPVFGSFYLD